MRPSRKPLTLALVVSAAIAGPALAQQAPSAYPPACETSKVSKSDVERAHTVFLSGKQFLEESNYEKAISYFKDAYSIDCSIHAILPIIATAYERKGDRPEAVRALEEYQKRAPTAPDHEVMERRIKNLRDQIAREQPAPAPSATAAPSPASTTPVPSTSAAPAPAPSAATSAGTAAPTTTVTASGGHTIAPWIVVGIGGAAVVAGAVVYAIGAGDVSSAEASCPNRKCAPGDNASASKGNDGNTLENVGGALLGVGAAAAAAGLVWHFLEPTGRAGAAPSAYAAPVVAPGYAGISLGSRF
jgi:hypothetical protein